MRFSEFKEALDPKQFLGGSIFDPTILKAISSGLLANKDMSNIFGQFGTGQDSADSTDSVDSLSQPNVSKGGPVKNKKLSPASNTSNISNTSNTTNTSGKPSEQLIQFVKQKEGFRPKAFWDYKQFTNGYGTKAKSRNEVIDEREADRRLREKAQEFYNIVVQFDRAHNYKFNDNQLNALTSFVFNGGPGWLNQVSANGRRSKQQIAQSMLTFNTAGGRRLGGLVARRQQEVAMFNAGSNMA